MKLRDINGLLKLYELRKSFTKQSFLKGGVLETLKTAIDTSEDNNRELREVELFGVIGILMSAPSTEDKVNFIKELQHKFKPLASLIAAATILNENDLFSQENLSLSKDSKNPEFIARVITLHKKYPAITVENIKTLSNVEYDVRSVGNLIFNLELLAKHEMLTEETFNALLAFKNGREKLDEAFIEKLSSHNNVLTLENVSIAISSNNNEIKVAEALGLLAEHRKELLNLENILTEQTKAVVNAHKNKDPVEAVLILRQLENAGILTQPNIDAVKTHPASLLHVLRLLKVAKVDLLTQENFDQVMHDSDIFSDKDVVTSLSNVSEVTQKMFDEMIVLCKKKDKDKDLAAEALVRYLDRISQQAEEKVEEKMEMVVAIRQEGAAPNEIEEDEIREEVPLPKSGPFSKDETNLDRLLEYKNVYRLMQFSEEEEKEFESLIKSDKAAAKNMLIRRYRDLAITYHPDKNNDNEKFGEYFKSFSNAYDRLTQKIDRPDLSSTLFDEENKSVPQKESYAECMARVKREFEEMKKRANAYVDKNVQWGEVLKNHGIVLFAYNAFISYPLKESKPKTGDLIRAIAINDFVQATKLVQDGNFSLVEKIQCEKLSSDYKRVCGFAEGASALHLACRFNFLEFVKAYYDDMAPALNVRDAAGNMPLHYAAQYGSIELLKFIFEKNPDSTLFLAANEEGKTPLQICLDIYLNKRNAAEIADIEKVKFFLGRELETKSLDEMTLLTKNDKRLSLKDYIKNFQEYNQYGGMFSERFPIQDIKDKKKQLNSVLNRMQSYLPGVLPSIESAKEKYSNVTSDHAPILLTIPYPEEGREPVKVVSWNVLETDSGNGFASNNQINYGETTEEMDARHQRIADSLGRFAKNHSPQFITLQEILNREPYLIEKIKKELGPDYECVMVDGKVVDSGGCITLYRVDQFVPLVTKEDGDCFNKGLPGGNITKFKSLTDEDQEIRIANVHHRFTELTVQHEESIKKFLTGQDQIKPVPDLSKKTLSIMAGDFNGSIVRLDGKQCNQTTSVSPSKFRVDAGDQEVIAACKAGLQVQGAWAIDGGFYSFRGKKDFWVGVACRQATSQLLNPFSGNPLSDDKLKPINRDKLLPLQRKEIHNLRLVISVDDSYTEDKIISNGKDSFTLFEYEERLREDFNLGEGSEGPIYVRRAANLNNEKGIGIVINKELYDYFIKLKHPSFQLNVKGDDVTGRSFRVIYANDANVPKLMKEMSVLQAKHQKINAMDKEIIARIKPLDLDKLEKNPHLIRNGSLPKKLEDIVQNLENFINEKNTSGWLYQLHIKNTDLTEQRMKVAFYLKKQLIEQLKTYNALGPYDKGEALHKLEIQSLHLLEQAKIVNAKVWKVFGRSVDDVGGLHALIETSTQEIRTLSQEIRRGMPKKGNK